MENSSIIRPQRKGVTLNFPTEWKTRPCDAASRENPSDHLSPLQPRASAGFWLGGQCPLVAWGEENFITPTPPAIQKTALFCVFSLFNFSSIFPRGGLADPICPYVRTPMVTTVSGGGCWRGTWVADSSVWRLNAWWRHRCWSRDVSAPAALRWKTADWPPR